MSHVLHSIQLRDRELAPRMELAAPLQTVASATAGAFSQASSRGVTHGTGSSFLQSSATRHSAVRDRDAYGELCDSDVGPSQTGEGDGRK